MPARPRRRAFGDVGRTDCHQRLSRGQRTGRIRSATLLDALNQKLAEQENIVARGQPKSERLLNLKEQDFALRGEAAGFGVTLKRILVGGQKIAEKRRGPRQLGRSWEAERGSMVEQARRRHGDRVPPWRFQERRPGLGILLVGDGVILFRRADRVGPVGTDRCPREQLLLLQAGEHVWWPERS